MLKLNRMKYKVIVQMLVQICTEETGFYMEPKALLFNLTMKKE